MDKYKNHGFKGMLSDRMPEVLDIAAKRCRLKGEYIDYLYKNFLKNQNNSKKKEIVKELCGLIPVIKNKEEFTELWYRFCPKERLNNKKLNNFPPKGYSYNFSNTIDWNVLKNTDKDLYLKFLLLDGWYKYFSKWYIYIKEVCLSNKKNGICIENTIKVLRKNFRLDDGTIKFILKYLKYE